MTRLAEAIFAFVLLATWVAGWVLAKGFWSTAAAIFFVPFWSFYLVMERALQLAGWL